MATTYAHETVQGDLEPGLDIALAVNGAAFALDPSDTVVMDWIMPDGSRRLSVAMVITSAPGGAVRRVWEAGDTDMAGVHSCKVVVVRGGRRRSFPSDKTYYKWRVNARVTPTA